VTQIRDELISLNDGALTTRRPEDDIRHCDVYDSGGEKLGHVSDLLVDKSEHHVRLMEVGHGGLLGIGESKVLVPIDAIVRIDGDSVHINRARSHVSEAPRYDPEVVDEDDYYNELYGHYGVAPYWGAGYIYPGYPFLI
jgi:sporulation protein YlmC with PRC-barrel domain